MWFQGFQEAGSLRIPLEGFRGKTGSGINSVAIKKYSKMKAVWNGCK